jgi:phage host-nuclease inhibitor protein Gam
MGTAVRNRTATHAALCTRLRAIAGVQIDLAAARARLAEETRAAEAAHEPRIAALEGRLDRLGRRLEDYCRANRDALFPAGARTVETSAGRVGFRRSTPAVLPAEGQDDRSVCGRLRAAGFARYVRVVEHPERAALRRAVQAGRLDAERLAGLGLRFVGPAERFHYDASPRAGGA